MQERLLHNFSFLMRDTWSMAFGLTWRLLLWSLLGAALLALLGGLVGWLSHRWLFRRFLDAPWRWYRWVRWVWPTLFISLTALGFLAAGAFLGAGYAIRQAINRDRIIDRMVVNLACVVVLENRQHMLTGQEDPEEIARLLDQSASLRAWAVEKTSESLRRDLETHAAEVAHPRLTAAFLWLAGRGWDKARDTTGLDLRPLYLAFRDPEALEAWKRDHPGSSATLAAFTGQMQAVRRGACQMVNQYVYTQALICAVAGWGAPVLLAIPAGFLLRAARRRWPGPAPSAHAAITRDSASATTAPPLLSPGPPPKPAVETGAATALPSGSNAPPPSS